MPTAYFDTDDGTWFRPTDLARGPWHPDQCHGGPPAALVIRALERLGLPHRLTRLTLELQRPVPMAGFRVVAEVRRAGRSVATTSARILDGDDRTCAVALAIHVLPTAAPTTSAPVDVPRLEDAVPAPFPVPLDHMGGSTFFSHSLEVRRAVVADTGPAGVDMGDADGLGPTTLWMRTVPIVTGEESSPLQRIGPLADCGNGISFNVPVAQLTCVNPDLTLTMLREPVGEWFASRAATHASNDGIGFSDAHLFDADGLVGRVTQSLVLRPA